MAAAQNGGEVDPPPKKKIGYCYQSKKGMGNVRSKASNVQCMDLNKETEGAALDTSFHNHLTIEKQSPRRKKRNCN